MLIAYTRCSGETRVSLCPLYYAAIIRMPFSQHKKFHSEVLHARTTISLCETCTTFDLALITCFTSTDKDVPECFLHFVSCGHHGLELNPSPQAWQHDTLATNHSYQVVTATYSRLTMCSIACYFAAHMDCNMRSIHIMHVLSLPPPPVCAMLV